MADANLLQTLDAETKLENMLIYGKVRCAIERPSFLNKNTVLVGGFFAIVDVVAYKCLGVDYFSKNSDDIDAKHIYFSKGSVLVALDDISLIGQHIKVFSKGTRGCNLKKQKTKDSTSGVVAFVWSKVGNDWAILPNRIVKFGEKDAKGTVLEDYLICIVNGVEFKHPSSTDTVMEYSGATDYKSLDMKDITGGLEYSTDFVDISKVSLNLVHNLKGSKESAFKQMVEKEVDEITRHAVESVKILRKNISNSLSKEEVVAKKREKEKEGVKVTYDEGDENIVLLNSIALTIIDQFIKKVASFPYETLGSRSKKKGKDYVNDLLDCILITRFNGTSEDARIKKEDYKELDALKEGYLIDPDKLRVGETTFINMLHPELYASLIIGTVLGLGCDTMAQSFNSCLRYNNMSIQEWFYCLIHNPYLLGLMGSGLSVSDCDKILLSFGQGYNRAALGFYRSQLMVLYELKSNSARSSMVQLLKVQNMANSFYPKKELDNFMKYGTPLSLDALDVVSSMNGKGKTSQASWFLNRPHTTKTLETLEKMGVVDNVNGSIILSRDLRKEYTIYETLMKLKQKDTGVTDNIISDCLESFEEKVGFELEPLQIDGLELTKKCAGVLSGCAGSGKTTVSDCIVSIFKKADTGKKIVFGAPTGKAARRLAEVVGGNVRTVHSLFKLGIGEEPYLISNDNGPTSPHEGGGTIYLLDEWGMATTDLTYQVVTRLKEEDQVYFLGDIKQLQPIGKGSPFANMMNFLPCIELGIGKRAAEGSKINYNCAVTNFASDSHFVEMQSDENFTIDDCLDAEIQMRVVNKFSELLKTYAEDEIQVITGYQTDKYPWSTTKLNPLLQTMIRHGDRVLFAHAQNIFRLNDRVIHTRVNSYNMPRFRRLTPTTFEEVPTFGMVNGELGKIVDVIKSSDAKIIPWDEDSVMPKEYKLPEDVVRDLLNRHANRQDELRDESLFHDDFTMFVIVEVYDVDLHDYVYVLYHGIFHDYLQTDDRGMYLSGGDVPMLDLAYALTTHKMQGSQSKAVIVPIGSTSNPTFINRNMINTMVSRAEEYVSLIGSVKGRSSALTCGRRQSDSGKCEDVLSILTNSGS